MSDLVQTKRRSLVRFKPGSIWWLLKHEIRLFFYEMGNQSTSEKNKGKRGMPTSGIVALGVATLFLHYFVFTLMMKMPALNGEPAPMILMVAGGAIFVVFTLMLSLALNKCVKALFERGDLDLLLSSPISSRSIFNMRLSGIVVGVSLVFLFFLMPFANIGLLLGQFRWLGIYPAIVCLAIVASGLAMLATLSLVKLFGVRKTLILAQLLSVFVGAAMFLLSQLFGNIGAEYRKSMVDFLAPLFGANGALGPDSWAWIPAKALFGSPIELGIFLLIACASFFLISRFTHQFFVRGVQQSAGMARVPTRTSSSNENSTATKKRFIRGIGKNILIKEWRLILRDPQLISHVFLQILYILPAFFLILKGNAVLSTTGAGITVISSFLASSLMWIIISGEDAPDLLGSAPIGASKIRNWKLIAAILPPLIFILPPLLWLMTSNPPLALLTLVCSCVSMYGVSLIHLWLGKSGKRTQFMQRKNSNIAANILEGLHNLSWGGTILLTMHFAWWGIIPAILAGTCVLMAWVFKREDQ